MKRLSGFAVGPPMVAIGALPPESVNASNVECFRIRKDEQMRNLLQWMEANNYEAAGSYRELYHSPPDAESPVLEVQYPVRAN